MKSMKIVGAAMGMLVGLSLATQATILPPGAVGLDAPQAAASSSPLGTLTAAYTFGNLSGTVTSWVTKDPANPLGGLSFYYQINNTGTEETSELSTSDFGLTPGSPVDVSTIVASYFGSLPGGIGATTAARSAGAGSEVHFLFPGAGEIEGGEHSTILVVNTAYQSFQITHGAVIDNNSANVSIFGPNLVQTPEPSSIVAASLLLLPFGASMLRILRKR